MKLFALALGSVLGVAGLGACGGSDSSSGDAFLGTYQVTSHRQNRMQGGSVACSDPGAEDPNKPPLIKIIVDPFFDDPHFLLLQTCISAGMCGDTQITFNPGGPGLEELGANTQTGGGTNCNLYASDNTAALAEPVLHIEARHWFDAPPISSSACTLDKAEALRDTATCLDVETWDATRTP